MRSLSILHAMSEFIGTVGVPRLADADGYFVLITRIGQEVLSRDNL